MRGVAGVFGRYLVATVPKALSAGIAREAGWEKEPCSFPGDSCLGKQARAELGGKKEGGKGPDGRRSGWRRKSKKRRLVARGTEGRGGKGGEKGREGKGVGGAGEAAALGVLTSRSSCQRELVALVDRSLQRGRRRAVICRSWGVCGDRIKSV